MYRFTIEAATFLESTQMSTSPTSVTSVSHSSGASSKHSAQESQTSATSERVDVSQLQFLSVGFHTSQLKALFGGNKLSTWRKHCLPPALKGKYFFS